MCMERLSEGSQCHRRGQCAEGLVCDGGSCVVNSTVACYYDREAHEVVGCVGNDTRCHGARSPLLANRCLTRVSCEMVENSGALNVTNTCPSVDAAICFRGMCVQCLPWEEASCDQATQYCHSGVCERRGDTGAPCNRGHECVSDRCDRMSHTCAEPEPVPTTGQPPANTTGQP